MVGKGGEMVKRRKFEEAKREVKRCILFSFFFLVGGLRHTYQKVVFSSSSSASHRLPGCSRSMAAILSPMPFVTSKPKIADRVRQVCLLFV
jgi:hypothetical protein